MFNDKETRNQLPLFEYPLRTVYGNAAANREAEIARLTEILSNGEFTNIEPYSYHGFRYEYDNDISINACIKRREPLKEVASYLLWKLGEFNFEIPLTVMRNNSHSAMLWTDDGSVDASDHDTIKYPEHVNLDAGFDIGVFDYVTGQTDRHNGNWQVSPTGNITLIDNGYGVKRQTSYATFFVDQFGGRKLEDRHINFLKIVSTLPDHFAGIGSDSVSTLRNNAQDLLDLGYLFGKNGAVKKAIDEDVVPANVEWHLDKFPQEVRELCKCNTCENEKNERRERAEKRREIEIAEMMNKREKEDIEYNRFMDARKAAKSLIRSAANRVRREDLKWIKDRRENVENGILNCNCAICKGRAQKIIDDTLKIDLKKGFVSVSIERRVGVNGSIKECGRRDCAVCKRKNNR